MFDFIHYQVRDVMTPNPVTVRPTSRLREVEAIFSDNDFNGLPVLDEENHLIGMVTKLDLLKAFIFTEVCKVPPYLVIMERSVSSVMNPELDTVDPEMPLTRVLGLMVKTRFKSLPVMDEGVLVGIVAREDVLKALARAAEGLLPDRLQQ
jgi:CBS domain-containing protein